MNSTSTNKTSAIELVIAGDLAGIGAAWISIENGVPRWSAVNDPVGAWRQALLVGAKPVREAVRKNLPVLIDGDGGACELFPGVMAIGCVSETRRGRCEGVAVLLTNDLITEGSLSMLCNAAKVDETVIRGFASRDALPPREAIPVITDLVRRLHVSTRRRIEEREAAHSVDRRLSESYEELHLLNSLIDGLVVGGDPGDFLVSAAEELAATAGYSWIAILLDDPGASRVDDFVVHGSGAPTRTEVRSIAESASTSTATAVVDPTFGEIGLAAVRGGDRSLGTLVAGGRAGEPISSIELTLLASAAGHLGVFLRNAALYSDLDAMFLGTLQSMVAAIDAKDPYTRGHSQRVAILSRDLAAAIGLPEAFVKTAHLSGLVHDIGKIGVPEAVLCKAGRLDDSEFAAIRQHPQIGFRILRDIPQIRDLLPGVLCHHESWDGSGYPAGIAGEEIPLLARIIAICDSFDAMSSNRTYRSAKPRQKVFEELRNCRGSQFDPSIVPVFLGMDFTEYDRLLARDADDFSLTDDRRVA
ncbi:MAG: HD-GYP domain-containing protein [Phycisphaerales bacterium]|jgi:HD-GYP domain-containing protein (c-di-GMP phosphodiesterase class II)|nr:HD-GYP domain-containing protein [Phycisphaerales bacterium]